MLQSLADQIIHQLEKDYDRIAPHFSDTRSHAWPEFYLLNNLINDCGVETIHELSLLDVGCGNGRLLETIPAVHYTGLDLSSQLLTIAQNRFPNYTFVHGSVLQLPFLDEQFDVVACVATWQHIPLVLYRHQALQEMVRVLKPGGHLFMLNWNLADQTQYQQYRADQTNGYDAGDYLIPWKNDRGEILTQRYYHGFSTPEIAELAKNAELTILQNELGKDCRNIVTIARKTNPTLYVCGLVT